MTGRAGTERSVVDFPRLALRQRDEVLHALHGQAWIDDQRLLDTDETADRDEVLFRVVAQLLEQTGIDDEGRLRTDEERVTIRRRARDVFRCDLIGRTRLVLDDDLLSPSLRELLADSAGDDIGDPSRRGRHHHGDGFGRIGFTMSKARAEADGESKADDETAYCYRKASASLHVVRSSRSLDVGPRPQRVL